MARDARPVSMLAVEAAQCAFGEDWGGRVAELTGLHRRSLSRLRQAARAGRDHPAAECVLMTVDRWALSVLALTTPHVKRETAMGGLRWDKAKLRGRATEEAFPKDEPVKGGWSHVKPEPVKRFTPAERAAWERKQRGEE